MFKISGVIALIDFETAFDTVRWKFLYETLNVMNFGPKFVSYIQLLYKDIQSACYNSGHLSEMFRPSRGIRQGCPVSALLFILVAEIMSVNIYSNNAIKGIKIDDTEFLISQLADDTTLFLDNIACLKAVFELLDEFHKHSGLKLNKSKTEIFYLGNTNHRPNDLLGCREANVSFKCLGIYFMKDPMMMAIKNIEETYKNFKTVLNIWSQRDLTLKGKITMIKSLALSQLLYASSMLNVPDTFIDKVEHDILNFIWNGKPPKVKTSTMISDISDGGLKMPPL